MLLVANHVQESVAHNGQEAVPGAGCRIAGPRVPSQVRAKDSLTEIEPPNMSLVLGLWTFTLLDRLSLFKGQGGSWMCLMPHALSSGQREEEKSIFYTKNLVIESWPASAATHTHTHRHVIFATALIVVYLGEVPGQTLSGGAVYDGLTSCRCRCCCSCCCCR